MCRTYIRKDGQHWTRLCHRTGHAGMRKPGRLGMEIPWELSCTRALATGQQTGNRPQRKKPSPRCRICGKPDLAGVLEDLEDSCEPCQKYIQWEMNKWKAP